MIKKDLELTSLRGSRIPCTVILSEKENSPLLICAHGFKANRTEDGRFLTVGEALAKEGVSFICMGFAGCDVSKEDFYYYSLSSCLDDVETCYQYMLNNYSIDRKRIGMIGYSMGGRVCAVFSQRHPEITTIGLWAGACFKDFDNKDYFLGPKLKDIYQEITDKGYYLYDNVFDHDFIKLSKKFMDDMKNYDPEAALQAFRGRTIIVQGDIDDMVDPTISYRSYNNLEKAEKRVLHIVKGADHGFGAWNNRPDLSFELTDKTIAFFKENLLWIIRLIYIKPIVPGLARSLVLEWVRLLRAGIIIRLSVPMMIFHII